MPFSLVTTCIIDIHAPLHRLFICIGTYRYICSYISSIFMPRSIDINMLASVSSCSLASPLVCVRPYDPPMPLISLPVSFLSRATMQYSFSVISSPFLRRAWISRTNPQFFQSIEKPCLVRVHPSLPSCQHVSRGWGAPRGSSRTGSDRLTRKIRRSGSFAAQ